MIRKNLITGIIVIVAALLLLQSGIVDVVLMFLFVGAIPGTPISLPPLVMLGLLIGAIIAFTHWVAARQLYPGSPKFNEKQKKALRASARRKVAKKTRKHKATAKTTRRYREA